MKKISSPILFFGSGPVAKASLQFILQHFKVEAIITKPATKDEMNELAGKVPVFAVQNAAELDGLVSKQRFKSKLGILVDFGVIVSKQVIDALPRGIVNSHFSLLPKLRGADPITFAILEGYEKTGVSLMLIDEKMDTGKLITQKTLHVKPDATTPSLTKELIILSNSLLLEYLPKYLSGKIKPRNQSHPDRATYTRKLTKEDGIINWTKPAQQIEREVRAYLGWPGSRTTIFGKDVIITKAKVNQETGEPGKHVVKDKELLMYAGKGALVIKRLKPAGKNEMSAPEFIRGYEK
jgi:methionyl-tRNA formyltransferase